MARDERTIEISQFARLLEGFGADQRRWPAGAAARFVPLLAREPAARRLLAQAEALDRLLDRGRGDAKVAAGLADRIVAAAVADPPRQRSEPEPSNVVPFGPRPATSRASNGPPLAPMRDRTRWQAAGLMAASLLMGVYLGVGGGMAPLVERFAEAVGLSLEGDAVTALIGQEAVAAQADEELL